MLLEADRRRRPPRCGARSSTGSSRHHDALRLRFARDGARVAAGARRGRGRRGSVGAIDLQRDCRGRGASAGRARRAAAAGEPRPRAGPAAARASCFDRGGRATRSLAVVDPSPGGGRRVLADPARGPGAALRQLERGERGAAGRRRRRSGSWARACSSSRAPSGPLAGERDVLAAVGAGAPVALAGGRSRTRARTRCVVRDGASTLSLSEDRDARLLQEVPRAYRTQINDVLLTALAEALARGRDGAGCWSTSKATAARTLFDDVDLSRTVGWFTALYPGGLDGRASAAGPGSIRRSRSSCGPVPATGSATARCATCGADAGAWLAAAPRPRSASTTSASSTRSWPAPPCSLRPRGAAARGTARPARARTRSTSLALVADGALELAVDLQPRSPRAETIERLAAGVLCARSTGVIAALRLAAGAAASRRRTSRWPASTRHELDALAAPGADVEDVYPLSPMQQLFLLDGMPRGSALGTRAVALRCGGTRPRALRRAWDRGVRAIPSSAPPSSGRARRPLQLVLRSGAAGADRRLAGPAPASRTRG